ISDLDGVWMNAPKNKLAKQYRDIIVRAVDDYISERSIPRLLREIGAALLAIFVLVLLIYGINRLFRKLKSGLENLKGTRLKGVHIRNYQFLDTDRQATVLLTLLNGVKWFVILAAVYFTITIMFGIFPSTEGLGPKLISYFIDPIKGIIN